MKMYKCDRCEKLYEHGMIAEYELHHNHMPHATKDNVDLCEQCLRDLQKWMKGE